MLSFENDYSAAACPHFERVLMTHIAHETTQADGHRHPQQGDTLTATKANRSLNQ